MSFEEKDIKKDILIKSFLNGDISWDQFVIEVDNLKHSRNTVQCDKYIYFMIGIFFVGIILLIIFEMIKS
jgi:hypothetical protein